MPGSIGRDARVREAFARPRMRLFQHACQPLSAGATRVPRYTEGPRLRPSDFGEAGLTFVLRTPAKQAFLFATTRSAEVAQLVEHVTENHGVGGSIPSLGTIFN